MEYYQLRPAGADTRAGVGALHRYRLSSPTFTDVRCDCPGLVRGRQMGYRIGTLQSSELGFPVYRRLGFKRVCQVEHFYWMGGNGAG